MYAKDDLTPEAIRACWTRLSPRFRREWDRMELVADWVTNAQDRLYERIWANTPQDDRGLITIYNVMPYAVNTTVIALFASRRPKVTVHMKNRKRQDQQERGNFNERVGHAMLAEFDRHRAVELEQEVKTMIITRGVCIMKRCWEDFEQRGESRAAISSSTYDEAIAADPQAPVLYDEANTETPYQEVMGEGRFPLYPEVLDPLDCVYTMAPGGYSPSLLVHHYQASWDELCETMPEIMDMEEFSHKRNPAALAQDWCEVYDYWDKHCHAIVVDNIFVLKPVEHHYDRLPFEIERVNEDILRYARVSKFAQLDEMGTSAQQVERVATPLVWPMLDNVTWASWGESLLASYLPDLATTPIIHRGISSGNNGGRASPYFERAVGRDGVMSKLPVYKFRGNKTAGGRAIWPIFDEENMFPLNPTPIADHLTVFMQARSRQMEMVSFGLEFLTGVLKAELSGYSAAQQKQLSIARTEPYRKAVNRLMSRFMTGCFELMGQEWDRGGVPLVLQSLTKEEDIELTREVVSQIGTVTYEIVQVVPSDIEAERQAVFQAHAQGLMPDIEAIENLAWSDDPQATLKQIVYDSIRKADIESAKHIAREWAKESGQPDPTGGMPPPAPPMPPMGAVPPGPPLPGSPPGGALPMDPMMGGGMVSGDPTMAMLGAPPVDPMMGGGGLPPELEAMMQDPAMMQMIMDMLAGQGLPSG